MKTINKTTAFLFLMIGMICMTFNDCKKYPDGPILSLHSRIERVVHTWKVESYTLNGNDQTSLYADYNETYTKDGNYFYTWGNFSGSGKWEFQDNDDQIFVFGIQGQPSETLIILKLEQDKFWYYYMDGNDRKEFHMIN